jgi:predicted GIY-YIG superfamily endonuclease
MYYVYFLTSETKKSWVYVGSTNNLERRIKEHNLGLSNSTRPYLPVHLDSYIAVSKEYKCRELEKYFKTGSGIAVLRKRILTNEASA